MWSLKDQPGSFCVEAGTQTRWWALFPSLEERSSAIDTKAGLRLCLAELKAKKQLEEPLWKMSSGTTVA